MPYNSVYCPFQESLCDETVKRADSKGRQKKIQDIEEKVKKEKGIFYCRIKVNEGKLQVGEDIMWVLIAGDFRENCFPVMEKTVGEVKEAISEKEV